MEPLLVVVVVLVALVVAGGWWLRRRRTQLVGDDPGWPAPTGPEIPSGSAGMEPPPLLDRDALLRGRRPFDPSGWDDTPDAEPAAEEPDSTPGNAEDDDLPTYFDRDFLAKRQRKGETDE